MDSESPEQAPSRSHSSVQSNVRTQTYIGWDYATLVVDANGKKSCICNFCNKVISGGGINRVKKHLAGYKGEVVACPKVPSDVRFTIQVPLLKLLRLLDSDEKPAIGYVYEGMRRARKWVKELFKKKKELYKPYTNIIDRRWDRMLRKSIHCAAYWLNPAIQEKL